MLKNLQKLRVDKELSYDDMGKIMNRTKATIFNWENGFTMPSIDDLIKLSNYFHVSIDFLLDREVKRDKKLNELFMELKKVDYAYILELIRKYLEDK